MGREPISFKVIFSSKSFEMLHGSVYDTHVHSKNYEKMIFVRLNFINMFTKYVYLKYELTLTHNIQQ